MTLGEWLEFFREPIRDTWAALAGWWAGRVQRWRDAKNERKRRKRARLDAAHKALFGPDASPDDLQRLLDGGLPDDYRDGRE